MTESGYFCSLPYHRVYREDDFYCNKHKTQNKFIKGDYMYLDNLKKDIEEKRLSEERAAVNKEKEKEENLVHEKAKDDKFNDIFGSFNKFIKDLKEEKLNIFSFILKKYKSEDNIYVNEYISDKNYILANLMGLTIAVKPIDIEIIQSISDSNKIYLAICFQPHESVKYIEEITWSIKDQELCSYTSNNLKPTDDEYFCIPREIYFGFHSKTNSSLQVKKKVNSFKHDKYYYGIEITFDEYENEYTIKSLRDRVIIPYKRGLNLNNNGFCFLNITTSRYMYDSVLDLKITKDEFINKSEIIFDDLYRIFKLDAMNTDQNIENEILKFEKKEKQKYLCKPFDLNKEYWDKPYNFLFEDVITNYHRYIAFQLQNNGDIKKLNREYFKYNYSSKKYPERY